MNEFSAQGAKCVASNLEGEWYEKKQCEEYPDQW